MKRWLALLIAIVGGAALAFALTLGATAVIAGFLWIYVFGDDPWPDAANTVLNIAIPVLGLAAWGFFCWVLYRNLTKPV